MVDLPLWKMMDFVSWDDDIPMIYGKITNVPNHQPDLSLHLAVCSGLWLCPLRLLGALRALRQLGLSRVGQYPSFNPATYGTPPVVCLYIDITYCIICIFCFITLLSTTPLLTGKKQADTLLKTQKPKRHGPLNVHQRYIWRNFYIDQLDPMIEVADKP